VAEGAEDAEHEPVHVEQRQAVHEVVAGRPRPRVGQRVEAGGDRAAGDDRALRPARRPAGVEHEGRGVAVRLRVRRGRAPRDVHRDVAAEDERRPGVAQQVRALGRAGVRRQRDGGHSGGERAGDRDDGLERRRRLHPDDRGACDPVGDRRRGAGEVLPGRRPAVDGDGVRAVRGTGTARQRRQQTSHQVTVTSRG
jgi:hypothetical protein